MSDFIYDNTGLAEEQTDYNGGFVYDKNFSSLETELYYFNFSEGRILNVSGWQYEYFMKDHLGSIRLTIDETGEIVSARDYYPYGEELRGVVSGGIEDKYQFTEKERDYNTELDYFGARYYDSEIGRWLSVDPLAEKYLGWSPYNYTLNNPLIFIDPNGEEVKIYAERIQPTDFNKFLAYLAFSKHMYIRVTTPNRDLILELQGPQDNPRYGTPKNDQPGEEFMNGREAVEPVEVIRPEGVDEDDYSFENRIFEVYDILIQILPKYDPFNANSNGFVKFIIEKAGGKINLPFGTLRAITRKFESVWFDYLYQKSHLAENKSRTDNDVILRPSHSSWRPPHAYDPWTGEQIYLR